MELTSHQIQLKEHKAEDLLETERLCLKQKRLKEGKLSLSGAETDEQH